MSRIGLGTIWRRDCKAQRAERLAAKFRELNIDPDALSGVKLEMNWAILVRSQQADFIYD